MNGSKDEQDGRAESESHQNITTLAGDAKHDGEATTETVPFPQKVSVGPEISADFSVHVIDDSRVADDTDEVATPAAPGGPSAPLDSSLISVKEESQIKPKSKGGRDRRLKRRGRELRKANIIEGEHLGLPLPTTQYEAVLIRRAVRKKEDHEIHEELPSEAAEAVSEEKEEQKKEEIFGDVSLGMTLKILEGKVVVYRLHALADGRASPAQLTGVVRRGDVLLSVNGASLVNLPLDPLMAALKPLSSPDPQTGAYLRRVSLRFAAGEGLNLVKQFEQENVARTVGEVRNRAEGALFPMVDQLSGVPLFDNQSRQEQKSDISVGNETLSSQEEQPEKKEPQKELEASPRKKRVSLDDRISESIATLRINDRDKFLAEFTEWSGNFADLKNLVESYVDHVTAVSELEMLTLPELVELGRKAIAGAKNLSKQMQVVDSGKDLRSFRSWNTTLSLYSRASTRRRRVFDSALSLPLNFDRVDEEEEEEDIRSTASSEGSQLDGDELLLRLAAHDEIWRKQVVEFLEKVAREGEDEDGEGEEKKGSAAESTDIDAALSSELGSFLFGENMAKILAKHKKPRSLPSEEVTTVLFDLTTKVSATVPDEIVGSGRKVSSGATLVPFVGMKRPPSGSDVILATRFLLDEALPAWLKSFRPLPWEQRRVLWPLDRPHSFGSTATSTLSSPDDSLTLDSMSINTQSPLSGRRRKRRNIREQIEDQEMNFETRKETCFLTTYYFTQKLLPRLAREVETDSVEKEKTLDEIIVFLGEYGSYLRMHTCLAYAILLKAEALIDLLLGIAKYDPRHREVMKQTAKFDSLVFYEPTMLSAVVQRLQGIQAEKHHERRLAIIDMCASAYPDVRPWQVHKACALAPEQDLKNLYYTYLSIILHPHDGSDNARRDGSLVKEWCELSTHEQLSGVGKENFLRVASRASSDHLVYHRDLVHLLKLSMEIKEYQLALDLSGELLEDPVVSKQRPALDLIHNSLRFIGLHALDEEGKQAAARTLKRILRLLQKPAIRRVVSVPNEYLVFIEHRVGEAATSLSSDTRFMEFLAEEATPSDLFMSLALWESSPSFQPKLYHLMHTLLRRGAFEQKNSEMSSSLSRLKRAREVSVGAAETLTDSNEMSQESIWKSMSQGMEPVAK